MFTDRAYKPQTAAVASGANPVTLRSWHRKGWTENLGFTAEGGHKLYSFHDMCIFATAMELDHSGIPLPQALYLAIEASDCILDIILQPDPSGISASFGQALSLEVSRHWKGFLVVYRQQNGEEKWEFHPRLDGLRMDMVFLAYAARSSTVVDIGRVCQDVSDRLLESLGSRA